MSFAKRKEYRRMGFHLCKPHRSTNWIKLADKKPLADNDKNNGDNLDIQIQTVKKSRRIRTARCLYLGYFIWRPQHMCHIVPDLRRHFVRRWPQDLLK